MYELVVLLDRLQLSRKRKMIQRLHRQLDRGKDSRYVLHVYTESMVGRERGRQVEGWR
jgi:hypothetical protein